MSEITVAYSFSASASSFGVVLLVIFFLYSLSNASALDDRVAISCSIFGSVIPVYKSVKSQAGRCFVVMGLIV